MLRAARGIAERVKAQCTVTCCGGLSGPHKVACCCDQFSPSKLNVCYGGRTAQCHVHAGINMSCFPRGLLNMYLFFLYLLLLNIILFEGGFVVFCHYLTPLTTGGAPIIIVRYGDLPWPVMLAIHQLPVPPWLMVGAGLRGGGVRIVISNPAILWGSRCGRLREVVTSR